MDRTPPEIEERVGPIGLCGLVRYKAEEKGFGPTFTGREAHSTSVLSVPLLAAGVGWPNNTKAASRRRNGHRRCLLFAGQKDHVHSVDLSRIPP